MAKTSFLLLATLALLAAVAAQAPTTPTTSSVVTSSSTTSSASGTATPTTTSGPPPAFTNSINFSSLANVISSYASAKPPAATGTAGAKGSAGNAVGPHMGAAAVVLAAVVAMF